MLYLRRFEAENPGERGIPLVVDNYTGVTRHTVAMVTWQGEWWCRDERLGVFALGLKVVDGGFPQGAERKVGRELSRRARQHYRGTDLTRLADEARNPTAERRAIDVVAAAGMVEGSTICWVAEGKREVPVLFFRPAPSRIGVYDPAYGSAVADTSASNVEQIVLAVTKRLGYAAQGVRAVTGAAPIEAAAVLR